MTYHVFSGTLNPTQSICCLLNQSVVFLSWSFYWPLCW